MTLSELIKKYGDDKVHFQKLDDAITGMSSSKSGTEIKFSTKETFHVDGTVKMGLVVWMDRDEVANIIAEDMED